jgi:hypothetical protein
VNELFKELADRIRGTVLDLDRVADRAVRSWSQSERALQDRDVYLDSVALNIHGFYSGLERVFEIIARQVDGTLPAGQVWHRDLLAQMAQDIPDARPGVISEEVATTLDQFRRFRHLVRNVYSMNLDPEKISGLVSSLPALWQQLRAELSSFADFVDDLAASLND